MVKIENHNILVDTGLGDKHDRKFIQRFAVKRGIGLVGRLRGLGISPEDIDIVINTHAHFDHCGGNTKKENGIIVPVFPKAEYLFQREELAEPFFWNNPLTRTRYIKEDFLLGQDFIQEDKAEIWPGITLKRTGGHTLGHQIIEIESEGKKTIYLGDLVPTVTHLKYPFIMAYDVEPLETLKRKMEILPKAAEEKTLLIFEHEPNFDAAFVKNEDGKISVLEKVKL